MAAPTLSAYGEVSNWFNKQNSGTTKSVSTVSGGGNLGWTAGDTIVVKGGIESGNGVATLSTPVNANLTFTLRASSVSASGAESCVYIWTAVAGSTEVNQTITVQLNITAATAAFGFNVKVWSGADGVANATANTNESATSRTVSAESVVDCLIIDWNATNPPNKSASTGSGTATRRRNAGDGSTYAQLDYDWIDTAAVTATFGAANYSGLQVAQAVIEILAAAGGTVNIDVPSGSVVLGGVPATISGTGSAAVNVPIASALFSGVAPSLLGSGVATIAVPAAPVTISALSPLVSGSGEANVAIPPASVLISGIPSVISGSGVSSVEIPAGSLVFSGVSPLVAGEGDVSLTIPIGALGLSGVSPSVLGVGEVSFTVPPSLLIVSGVSPQLAPEGAAPVTIPTAILTFSGVSPSLLGAGEAQITIPAADLILSGISPTLLGAGSITVPTGTILITGMIPSLSGVGDVPVIIPVGQVPISGVSPIVSGSGQVAASIPVGTFSIGGVPPLVAGSGQSSLIVPPGLLVLDGVLIQVSAGSAGPIDFVVPVGVLELLALAPTVTRVSLTDIHGHRWTVELTPFRLTQGLTGDRGSRDWTGLRGTIVT